MDNHFSLEKDGDQLEKVYWPLFIKNEFPSYEKFWIKWVVPVTGRPKHINFRTTDELLAIGKSDSDVYNAQLFYSTLRHLIRSYQILSELTSAVDVERQLSLITEGFARLIGAQDNIFELLERINKPRNYQPFPDGSTAKKVRNQWITVHNPLKDIRNYRNYLVHGIMPPAIIDNQRLCLPDIGKELDYLDWRKITQLWVNRTDEVKIKADFISVLGILQKAWDKTISYIEDQIKILV